MFKTTRGITVLVVAFVLTLACLRYINRERPVIAFEQTYTIDFKRFNAYHFKAAWPTQLVFIVKSKSDIPCDAFVVTDEEYRYFDMVDRGEIPLTRPIDFLWEGRNATSHRSDPVHISADSYVLYVKNDQPENTRKLPIDVVVMAEDLLSVE